jgi:hypothetical protein
MTWKSEAWRRWFAGQSITKIAHALRVPKRMVTKLIKENPMAKKAKKRNRNAKHRKNPKQMLFRTKKAARAYAKAHGAKKFSIRKLKKGR